MTRQNEPKPTLTQLEAAAIGLLDEAIARMGSDPCIYSIDLAIDQITSEVATTPDDHAAVRSVLRERVGLDVSTPPPHLRETRRTPHFGGATAALPSVRMTDE